MIDHGFRLVRASLDNTERFHCESPIRRAITKAVFRTMDHAAALKAAILRGRQSFSIHIIGPIGIPGRRMPGLVQRLV